MINQRYQTATNFAITIDGEDFKGFEQRITDFQIPGLSFAESRQEARLAAVRVPGSGVEFENLNVNCIVEDGFDNYVAIYNWALKNLNGEGLVKDITVHAYLGNGKRAWGVKFVDAFPVNLSVDPFTTKDESDTILSYDVTFSYAWMEFE